MKTCPLQVRTSVKFYRPQTFRPARAPKYPRKSTPSRNRMDAYNIIKHPLTTESAMKKIEDNNTLVFICDIKANKHQIKSAVKKLYDINISKVTLFVFLCHHVVFSFRTFFLIEMMIKACQLSRLFDYPFLHYLILAVLLVCELKSLKQTADK